MYGCNTPVVTWQVVIPNFGQIGDRARVRWEAWSRILQLMWLGRHVMGCPRPLELNLSGDVFLQVVLKINVALTTAALDVSRHWSPIMSPGSQVCPLTVMQLCHKRISGIF